MQYEHVIRAVANQPWMITREKADQIIAVLQLRATGGSAPPEVLAELREAAQGRSATPSGGAVAVLPLVGIMSQRASLMDEMSGPGGVSTQKVTQAFRQALGDPNVSAIVFDVDSPGGSVYGIDELASEIFQARGRKPMIAVANSLMASAAFYVGSQADEVWVTPGGEAGSIGVLAIHDDISKALDQKGIKPTYVTAGKYKAELASDFPLTDEARAYLQAQVDRYYGMFVAAVARGRGVRAAEVRGGMGEGRVVGAQEAVRLGMADRVGTLEEAIQRAASGRVGRSKMAAGGQAPVILAGEPRTVLVAGPIPPHDSPSIAADDAEWDAGAEVAAAEGAAELRRMHAWVDSAGDPEAKSSYKLPHHRSDGTLVKRGLFAAAQRLDQTDIPEGDKPGVRRHLGHHYDEIDMTPPWETQEPGQDAAAQRDQDLLRLDLDLVS